MTLLVRSLVALESLLLTAGLLAYNSLTWSQTVPEIAAASIPAPSGFGSEDWFEREVWREADRGFHYYPPERRPPMKREPRKAIPKDLKALTDIEELQAEVKRLRGIAVMQPTEDNMKAYLEANTLMMAKAAMFSDVWRRTVWTNPQFDYNAVQPTANFALADLKNVRSDNKAAWLRALAKDFGLVFFYRGDCAYCKIQAPVLQMLTNAYGIEVLPVSMDGAPLEGFPNARPDNGISRRISQGQGVTMVPTLYLVSRETSEAVLLGSGVLAADEIIERVHVLTNVRPGEGLAGGAEAQTGVDVTRVQRSAQRSGVPQ